MAFRRRSVLFLKNLIRLIDRLARKQTENQVKMRLSFHLPCDKEDEVDYVFSFKYFYINIQENEDSSQEVIAALRAQYEEKVNELNLAISENEKLSKSLQDSEVHAKQNHSLMIQVADSLEKLKHLNELLRNSAVLFWIFGCVIFAGKFR